MSTTPGAPVQTNDLLQLVPRTDLPGPFLELDLPGLEIGAAEYAEGPTGCTVFHFPAGAACAADVRGGSPGVMGEYGFTHAICLAGGSLYGLEAATGVSAELFARRAYSTRWHELALVSGAIIFDYGPRRSAVYPDKALGRAALRAARPGRFPLGPRGAGASATVGKWSGAGTSEPAGQGGAFAVQGPTRIAVFTVVNAMGAIVDRSGKVVRGCLDPASGQHRSPLELVGRAPGPPAGASSPPGDSPPTANTTLTVLVTNQRLDRRSLEQVGRQVHASMARAIQPFHCLEDGDVLFAATTAEVDDPDLSPSALGLLAAEVAWDAVLSCWQQARSP
jgi:6-aminohexanoate-oligomer endohydrolase